MSIHVISINNANSIRKATCQLLRANSDYWLFGLTQEYVNMCGIVPVINKIATINLHAIIYKRNQILLNGNTVQIAISFSINKLGEERKLSKAM